MLSCDKHAAFSAVAFVTYHNRMNILYSRFMKNILPDKNISMNKVQIFN